MGFSGRKAEYGNTPTNQTFTFQEKDKIIRNLEHKLPQVLADVSRLVIFSSVATL